jgi:hypothetical protein
VRVGVVALEAKRPALQLSACSTLYLDSPHSTIRLRALVHEMLYVFAVVDSCA